MASYTRSAWLAIATATSSFAWSQPVMAGFASFTGGLHPPGATASAMVNGQKLTRPVGFATVGGAVHAGQWHFAANNVGAFTWVDLNPAGATQSRAYAAHHTSVAGEATFGGMSNAVLWRSNSGADGYRNLNPIGATQSAAHDVRRTSAGHRTVGWAEVGGMTRASLWRGNADTWIDLNPNTATASQALAYHMGKEVGWAEFGGVTNAGLWSGTAASWINLHPGAATSSMALGIQAGWQAGWAMIGGMMHASLWSGSAGSWIDLNPAGATQSVANDFRKVGSHGSGSRQVGWAEINGQRRAAFWSGTAGSWHDLHSDLPSSFEWSEVTGAWREGNFKYYSGHGFNSDTGLVEAIYWQLPTPGASALLGLAAVAVCRRRR